MSFSTKLLDGKVGIVTGAGSPCGIGRSLVISLAIAGAKAVYATDLNLNNITTLRKEVEHSGSKCQIHGEILDVTSEEQTIHVLKKVVSTFGRLDFFFANAGIGGYRSAGKMLPDRCTSISNSHRSLYDTDAAYYDKVTSVLQHSTFLAIRYGGQAMSVTSTDKTCPGGSIIATSSMAGVAGAVSDISYCGCRLVDFSWCNDVTDDFVATAKAATSAMVKHGSVQLSASNVRVNAMAPGFVRTSITATTRNVLAGSADVSTLSKEEAMKAFESDLGDFVEGSKYYYQRVAEPEEVANIGVFLASHLSASINGQNIVADSGKTVAALGETVIGSIPPMLPF